MGRENGLRLYSSSLNFLLDGIWQKKRLVIMNDPAGAFVKDLAVNVNIWRVTSPPLAKPVWVYSDDYLSMNHCFERGRATLLYRPVNPSLMQRIGCRADRRPIRLDLPSLRCVNTDPVLSSPIFQNAMSPLVKHHSLTEMEPVDSRAFQTRRVYLLQQSQLTQHIHRSDSEVLVTFSTADMVCLR